MTQCLRFSQVSLAASQLHFRAQTLGDIDDGAYEFNQFTGPLEDWMTYYGDVSDSATWTNDSIVHFEIGPLTDGFLEPFPARALIVRVDTLEKCFKWRWRPGRVKTEETVTFLGPVSNVSRSRAPCPATGATKPLGLGQISFALRECFIGLFDLPNGLLQTIARSSERFCRFPLQDAQCTHKKRGYNEDEKPRYLSRFRSQGINWR